MQDIVAERAFYDKLFSENPDNEHIVEGYDELYSVAFPELPRGPIFDLGCGTGGHAIRLAKRGYAVVAVELTRAGIRAARERFRRASSSQLSPPLCGLQRGLGSASGRGRSPILRSRL